MASKKSRNASTPITFKVLNKITRKLDEFTPRQRMLAEYILQHPENLAFFPITDLAVKAGVSEATIVRFSYALGYEGYPQLVREAQRAIQFELGSAGRFQLVRRMRSGSSKKEPTSSFERVLKYEIENLVNLSQSIKISDFYRCIDMLAEADRICIVGCLASTSLATFFGNMLSKISHQVDIFHGHGVMTSAVINRLTQNSLVFLIAFPRYPREIVEIGQIIGEKGARIVAITDSHISPIVPLANLYFAVPVGIPSFVDAYAGPIVFFNALVTELSERDPGSAQQILGQYDEYALEANLFLKSGAKVSQSNIKHRNRKMSQKKA
jgi:DNA-binding MurR/RpiR family transcriptional regulator